MKRILALLLVVSMLTTVFAGCKKSSADSSDNVSTIYETEYEYVQGDGTVVSNEDGNDSTTEEKNEGTSSGNKTSSSDKSGKDDKTSSSNKNNNASSDNKNNNTNSTPIKEDGNTNKTGFPIVKKQETISVMTQTTAGLGDFTDSEFTKEYEELTNMKIEWRLTNQSEYANKLSLALQSGNLPDIISGINLDDETMLRYGSEGAFVELTKELIKEWAPNVYESYNNYPEAWKKTVTSNGKMYSFARLSKDYNYAQHYMWVRTSWLKKLGISKPKTMDEFYNMLIAFRDGDPNGNGQKDEVPYATLSDSGFIFNPWGFTTTIDVSTKGKVTNMYNTQNMKDAVSFWAKVYKENLVDKNTINNYSGGTYAPFHTLLSSGKVGCFFVGYPKFDDTLLKEYEILEYPTAGNNGDFPTQAIYVTPVVNRGYTYITKSCKNVTAAIRWVDYLYTNDGYLLKQYGAEGGYYKKVSDTTYTLTGAEAPSVPGPQWAVSGRMFLEGASINNKVSSLTDIQRANMDSWCEATLNSNKQKLMPTTWKNQSEINAEKLYTSYWNEVKNQYWQFIQGKKNMGSDWTTLINEMKSKGVDKYIAELQKYYDRCN